MQTLPITDAVLPPTPGRRALRWSVLIAAAGIGPLLLYIAVGPADGNPIGLGLLAMVAAPAAATLALVGAAQWIVGKAAAAARGR